MMYKLDVKVLPSFASNFQNYQNDQKIVQQRKDEKES